MMKLEKNLPRREEKNISKDLMKKELQNILLISQLVVQPHYK